MSPTDLEAYGIYEGRKTKLKFEGGIIVEGEIITGKRNLQGKIILISFKNCKVTFGDQVLFHPSWGIYDMAVGESIVSAFSGIADPNAYGLTFAVPKEKTHKIHYSMKEEKLFSLYDTVARMRRSRNRNVDELTEVFTKLKDDYPKDWLLTLEIYELIHEDPGSALCKKVKSYLEKLSEKEPVKHLIQDGIQLLKN
jgi:phenylalanine-4-hydroxylase